MRHYLGYLVQKVRTEPLRNASQTNKLGKNEKMDYIQSIIDNYDYLNQPMVKKNNKLTSLEALIAALGICVEIDLNFVGKRWYIGPKEDYYVLSKDNGEWEKIFKNLEDLLNFKFENKTLKNNWNEIVVNEL